MIHLERMGLGLAVLATIYSSVKGLMWADKRYPGLVFRLERGAGLFVKGCIWLGWAYVIGWFFSEYVVNG